MLKNKKGFTLIELLAILVLLALILVMVVPVISDFISASGDNLYKQQIKSLKEATDKWVINNTSSIDSTDGFSCNLNISSLLCQGYITNATIKDPKTGGNMEGCMKISYDSEYKQYSYKYLKLSECSEEEKCPNQDLGILCN